jgi:hypothetical protein
MEISSFKTFFVAMYVIFYIQGMPKISDFDCISQSKNKTAFEKKTHQKVLGSPLYFSP